MSDSTKNGTLPDLHTRSYGESPAISAITRHIKKWYKKEEQDGTTKTDAVHSDPEIPEGAD